MLAPSEAKREKRNLEEISLLPACRSRKRQPGWQLHYAPGGTPRGLLVFGR